MADVAPYSEEYRMARKEVSLLNQHGLLDDNQKLEYAEIREQVTSKNKRKNFYNDRFRDLDVSYETLTIDKIIDQNTFLTKEYGNNPIRFAGVRAKKSDEETMALLNHMLRPGTKVRVALDNNPQTRIRDDIYDTMRAVVFAPRNETTTWGGLRGDVTRGQSLNYWLSKQENVTINDDGTDISTLALFNDGERLFGATADWLIRDVVPNVPVLNVVQNIFLPVRTPVEEYEREVFSKSWRPWDNPVKGWIEPMFDSMTSQNPLGGFLHGAGLGYMMSANNKWKWAWIGGLTQGVVSGIRTLHDANSREDSEGYDIWKPERREKEFEINEYFDRLTYIKYKGLYAKAVEMAKQKEGVDLERLFKLQEKQKNKNNEEYLLERKKWLTIEKKALGEEKDEKIEEELEKVKARLENIGNEEYLAQIGPYTALALRYKETYESTLYAAGRGETFDYNKIYRALPYKDRPYFTEFIKANPRDRQRILQLIPDNQRPIYQRYFGMEMEEVESNEEYFNRYNLPDHDWEGWEAGHSLDNVKIKVMKNEGIERTEANYWPEDEAIAEEYGLDAIEMEAPSIADRINTEELSKILRGAGLEDVKITFMSTESDTNHFNTQLDIEYDRTREVTMGLQEYMQYI